MLASGALIASILAVGAGPVSGQQPISSGSDPNNNPDWGASWSACVGSAGSHDAMFSDVSEDSVHADAINCIAYYGVTLGVGDGAYAPGENVTAFQMRLFVQRAADLMGADGDAVLGKVMLSDTVTRLEMAKLMFGLVNDIDDGVRYHPRNNDIEHRDDAGRWRVVDDYFADARASVPIAESQVVGAAYELGITRGTKGDGTLVSTAGSTFEPFANVTRAEMASFIARTLDHSNLRPEGVSVQRNTRNDTQVSLRDGDFAPVANAPVDVLSALYPDDAFDDDGSCVLRFVKDETPSHNVCAIDIGDQITDDEGNVEFELATDRDPITVTCGTGTYTFTSAGPAGATVFWAWTGEQGDKVDNDTDLARLESVARPVGKAGPNYLRISGGLPTDDELAKMGETVTFTAQLYSDTGTRDGATLKDDEAVGPDRTGNVYLLQIERYHLTRVRNTDSDYGDKADMDLNTPRSRSGSASTGGGALFGDAPGDWNFGRTSQPGQSQTLTSSELIAQAHQRARIGAAYYTPVFPNADGMFTIDLQNIDVNAAGNDTDVGVRFVLRPFRPSNDILDENKLTDIVESSHGVMEDARLKNAFGTDVVVGAVIFSDDPSDTHSVSGQSEAYRIISGSRTPNTVTVKVVDQYGDPLRNVDVTVKSGLDMAAMDDDGVLYPEQVDITVQGGENGDGDTTANEATLVNPIDRVTSLTAATNIAANASPAPTVAPTVLATLRVTDAAGAVAQVPADDVIGTFKTRRDGTYRIGYAYTASTKAQTETITPSSARIVRLGIAPGTNSVSPRSAGATRNTVGLAEATVTDAEIGSPVMVYWAKTGTRGMSVSASLPSSELGSVPLRVADVGRRTIIANESVTGEAADTSDEPAAYYYDEDDVFIIDSIGASFEMFEEALGLTVKDNGCRANMVQWQNYTFYRDPNRYGAQPGRVSRTIWTINIGN